MTDSKRPKGARRGAGTNDAGAENGEPLQFEEALERLEVLVEEMESGDLPLEETIARFEEGQKLLRTCGELLDRAEQRVKTILKRADGTFETEDWDEEEADGDEGA
ncbi:MAG: exodeoxyribonuclease VII small subunit [Candidatus Eisenbacteria bacterium]